MRGVPKETEEGREEPPAGPQWVTEIARLWPPQGQWTEIEYFKLPDTMRFLELSDGDLLMPPHPTHTHQTIVLKLAALLQAFVEKRNLGIVQIGPLPVRLWPDKVREPDILFVAREHSDRIGEQFYGPPDLVVEVLSPSTRRTDRLEKTVEYARAGVAEYWLVDPEAATVEVMTLREGAYELHGKWERDETAASRLLRGLEIPLAECFPPSVGASRSEDADPRAGQ